MKLIITGHTSGLGKSLYDYYSKNNEVIGISRSVGYDVNDDSKFEHLILDSDVFFNNVHSGISQSKLIEKYHNILPIITSGSMGADFYMLKNRYYKEKKIIEHTHKKFSKISKFPMLLLKMGYLEHKKDKTEFPISFDCIIDSVNCWIKNPRITMIEIDNAKSEKALFCGKNTTKQSLDTEDK